mgnify:CR=1 FL=1
MTNRIATFILLFFSTCAMAQMVSTENTIHVHKKESADAYKIIVDADKSDAKEYWNDFIQDENDRKIRGYGLFSKKDLLETDMIVIPALSNNPLKLFMHFEDAGDQTHMYLFAQKENGSFVSKDDKMIYQNLQRLGNGYLEYFLPSYYREVLRDAEDNLEDAQKDVEKIKDDIKDDEEDIVSMKEKIKKLERRIEEDKAEQKELEAELERAQKLAKRKKYTYSEVRQEVEKLRGNK